MNHIFQSVIDTIVASIKREIKVLKKENAELKHIIKQYKQMCDDNQLQHICDDICDEQIMNDIKERHK